MSATINFYIRSERPHADHSVQIYMLFTINRNLKLKISLKKDVPIKKEFAQLSTQEIIKLEPSLRNKVFCWDCEKQRVTSQAPNHDKINQFLDAEKKRANDIILKYELMGKPLTLEIFKKQFCRATGHLSFAEYFLEELSSIASISLASGEETICGDNGEHKGEPISILQTRYRDNTSYTSIFIRCICSMDLKRKTFDEHIWECMMENAEEVESGKFRPRSFKYWRIRNRMPSKVPTKLWVSLCFRHLQNWYN